MSSMVDGNSSSSHAADSLAESARMNAALPLGKKLKSRVHFTGCSRFNDRGDREPNVLYAEEGMVEEVLTEDGTSQRDMIVRVRFPFYVNASVIERYTECKLDEVRCSSAAPRHPLARRYLEAAAPAPTTAAAAEAAVPNLDLARAAFLVDVDVMRAAIIPTVLTESILQPPVKHGPPITAAVYA